MNEKVNLGKKGEELAARYLQEQGYKILEKNFRCKVGEIDIVALDPSTGSGQVLVFVEVKTRWSKKFGEPLEAITPWKIKKIIKAGDYYKMLHPKLPEALRLDAVAISMDINHQVGKIELVKNLTG